MTFASVGISCVLSVPLLIRSALSYKNFGWFLFSAPVSVTPIVSYLVLLYLILSYWSHSIVSYLIISHLAKICYDNMGYDRIRNFMRSKTYVILVLGLTKTIWDTIGTTKKKARSPYFEKCEFIFWISISKGLYDKMKE